MHFQGVGGGRVGGGGGQLFSKDKVFKRKEFVPIGNKILPFR